MRLFIFLAVVCISTEVLGQNAKARQMFAEIQGEYELDDNGNVTYVNVIEVPELSSETIWERSLNYFTYHYGDGKSVIQLQDKETGKLTAKGIYDDVHVGMNAIATVVIDCWHVVRIDVKEGRARVIVTLTDYEVTTGGGGEINTRLNPVSNEFPINPGMKYQKTIMTKAFVMSHEKALDTVSKIEKAIREGNIDSAIDDEW